MSSTNLTVAEAFLLLALREKDGRPLIGSIELTTALAGAVLTDLAITGRIGVENDRVIHRDPTPLGDSELDTVLARIVAETKDSAG